MLANEGTNQAADWWAVGVLIFELVARMPPFTHPHDMQLTFENIARGTIHWAVALDEASTHVTLSTFESAHLGAHAPHRSPVPHKHVVRAHRHTTRPGRRPCARRRALVGVDRAAARDAAPPRTRPARGASPWLPAVAKW